MEALKTLTVPAIMIIIEAIKRTGLVNKKWLPLISVSLGIAMGVVFAVMDPDNAFVNILYGILYGGSASGLYDLGASQKKSEE